MSENAIYRHPRKRALAAAFICSGHLGGVSIWSTAIWTVLLLFGTQKPCWAAVHYVAWNAAGDNDGTSWSDAYTDPQSALGVAAPGDEIWVAVGTYKPTAGSDRTSSFRLKPGVALYGGFSGAETSLSGRDPHLNETILSGDIGLPGNPSDNVYHVVVGASNSRLDGFTITGGNAVGTGDDARGGGIYCLNTSAMVIENNRIVGNIAANSASRGAGLCAYSSSLTVARNTIAGNTATGTTARGGGVYYYTSSGTFAENVVKSNISTGSHMWSGGGGIYLEASSIQILNSAFEGNEASVSGGGIHCLESSPTIQGNTIVGNAVTNPTLSINWGGGIALHFASPRIIDNTIKGNRAPYGGGIGCGRPDTASTEGQLIDRNRIVGNVAYGSYGGVWAYGGGIYGEASHATLTNNLIAENESRGSSFGGGGGLYGRYASLIVRNNTIVGNQAFSGGGGIYCYGAEGYPSSIVLTNTIVAMNSSGIFNSPLSTVTLQHCCMYGNDGSDLSGVADPSGANGNICADPKFASLAYGNWHIQPDSPCVDAGGGAGASGNFDIDGQPRVQPGGGQVDIGADESDGSSWAEEPGVIVRVAPEGEDSNDGLSWAAAKKTIQAAIDAASVGGGDVWVKTGTYVERIVLKRHAHVYGGFAGSEEEFAARNWLTNRTVLDGAFQGSVVTAKECGSGFSTIDGFTISNGTGTTAGKETNGGGIYCSMASPRIANNTIIGNSAGQGGGVYCVQSVSQLNGNIVTGNIASRGGGIYCGSSSLRILNNSITNNIASSEGGGMLSWSSSSTFFGNEVTGNRAYTGGGVYFHQSSPVISASTFAANTASADGGGIVFSESSLTITGSMVRENGASRGGGIYSYSCTAGTIADNVIEDNRAENSASRGAGLCAYSSSLTVARNTIAGNTATGTTARGGGVYYYTSSGTFAENVVKSNISTGSHMWSGGGGIYLEASSTQIVNNTFEGNEASVSGGGIHCLESSPTIQGNTIVGNAVTNPTLSINWGGGIALHAASPRIIDNTIKGNRAPYGGGIGCGRPDTAVTEDQLIDRNRIVGNVAYGSYGGVWAYGGGIYCEASRATLTNNLIAENDSRGSSFGGGGGLYGRYASLVVGNNTIVGNRALSGGGGIYCYAAEGYPSSILLTNTIVAMNSSGIFNSPLSTVTLQHCCLYGNRAYSYSGLNDPVGRGGNINLDPLLTPDGHLRSGSPCIDAGLYGSAPSVDRDGESRPRGAGLDIGSDEFIDSDADGLPDWWEIEYFGSAIGADAARDNDCDGLTNLQECEHYGGTPLSPPVYVSITDGDDQFDGSTPEPLYDRMGPKRTIQAGIDTTGEGGTVLVLPGVYTGAGNKSLNFGGKTVVVRATSLIHPGSLNDPGMTILDCEGEGRAIDLQSVAFGFLEGFTIRNGSADQGGAVQGFSGLALSHCVIEGNVATHEAGGLHAQDANLHIQDVRLAGNIAPEGKPGAAFLERCTVAMPGELVVGSGMVESWSSLFDGQGTGGIVLNAGTGLMVNGGLPGIAPTVIRSRVNGMGDIHIMAGQELILEHGATVDLSGGAGGSCGDGCVTAGDSSEWGSITIDGTLLVRDATVRNTNVEVAEAQFGPAASIIYNDIRMPEPTAGFGGQFFVESGARIECNTIYSQGDRYLDYDPEPGDRNRNICHNNVHVEITQGVGHKQGTLLELRALDYDCGTPTNPDCESGAFAAPGSAGFTADASENWVLQTLIIMPGAKLNLTNRPGFQFQTSTAAPETVYVRQLVLHPNAILNTTLQTLYYQELLLGDGSDDPANWTVWSGDGSPYPDPFPNGARIVDAPLLGFSLAVIAFDDTTPPPHGEFDIRSRRRVLDERDEQDCECTGTCPDNDPPQDETTCEEGSIQHLRGVRGLGDGVMEMRTQAEGKQSASSVAAKGSFARAGEETIVIAFEYQFIRGGEAEDAEIVVKLSDKPEVDLGNYEVGRVRPPTPGQPGAVGSSDYALYYIEVPYEDWSAHLGRFNRGTYVELELRGKGAVVRIDNWDPQVICSYTCADFTKNGVSTDDFLILLAEYGRSPAQTGHSCLDMYLSRDQHLDLTDLLSWDTYVAGGFNSCTAGGVTLNYSESANPAITTATFAQGSFVISGKPTTPGNQQDRIYTFNSVGAQTGSQNPWTTPSPTPAGYRGNGRLIRDGQGNVYQFHAKQGLVRATDGVAIIPPKSRDSGGLKWQNRPVSVGVTPGSGTSFTGVPLTDAVFDPKDANAVYVTPVLVWVASPAHTYRATAKLVLDTQNPGQYSLAAVYGADPWTDPLATTTSPPEASYSATRLRELEIDRTGTRLFVTSSRADNGNEWLLSYDLQQGTETRHRLTSLAASLKSPTAMLASSRLDKLYLASADQASAWKLSRLDISGSSPVYEGELVLPAPQAGHARQVTTISEDPNSGKLLLLGFELPVFPDTKSFSNSDALFTTPLLLTITPADPWPTSGIQTTPLSGSDLALPVSMVYVGGNSPADFNGDGHVDSTDLEIFAACAKGPEVSYNPATLPSGCAPMPVKDGIIAADFDKDQDVDATDFAEFQRALTR